MTGALEWLKESFTDVADDLEIEPHEDDEGIPLIAFTDDATSAMEESQFLALLKAFKIKKPANEQVRMKPPVHSWIRIAKPPPGSLSHVFTRNLKGGTTVCAY